MNSSNPVSVNGEFALLNAPQPSTTIVVADVNGLPLHITLTVKVESIVPRPTARLAEEIVDDTEAPALDYSNRKGYDPNFLGEDQFRCPNCRPS